MEVLKLIGKTKFIVAAFAMVAFVSCEDQQEVLIEEDCSAVEDVVLKATPNYNVGCTSSSPGQANADMWNHVNAGTLDDRTCQYEYYETTISNKKFGAYKIKHNTNNVLPYHLQPRMERYFDRVSKKGGNYATFSGTFRIGRVGDTGTYIAQAKGNHTGATNDPAIVLFRADPYPSKTDQKQFKIYAEYITQRGGTTIGNGRGEKYITTVNRYTNFGVSITCGFWGSPVVNNHYVNATINGVSYHLTVPDPGLAINTGIRYGAYRVNGGEADVRVADTYHYEKK